MLIRPAVIRECSACVGFIYQYSKPYGASYRPVLWTDGKLANRNRIADPKLAVCPHCGALLWIDEMKRHGEEIVCVEQIFNETRKVILLRDPNFRHYAALLEDGALSLEKERYTRLALWWVGNDARRRPDSKALGPGFRERTNMAALAESLDVDEACDRVVKAELMRELGLLDEARALLAEPVDNALRDLVEVIVSLIDSGDTRVRPVLAGNEIWLWSTTWKPS